MTETSGPARETRRGRHALACLRRGIDAVEPEALVRSFFRRHPGAAHSARRVHVAAFGKAASSMTRGAIAALDEAVVAVGRVVVVVPEDSMPTVPEVAEAHAGGHPTPTEGSVRGAESVRDLAAHSRADELLLVLISGGGSSLLTLPPEGVSLDDLRDATGTLLRAGASIDDLNCLRKHLDQLKGGRLAQRARPARVLALVLSDVVGDRLDVIASGPVNPDPTTFADALAVVDRHELRGALPESVIRHLTSGAATGEGESPGDDDPAFDSVETHVVGDNRLAADAVLAEAARLGYARRLLTTTLIGEARDVGARLARLGRDAAQPAALLAAGETTVTVTGSGRGGRNQEVALGAALELADPDSEHRSRTRDVTVASLGTDGIDGPTDAAGAVADARTVVRARRAGVDASARLADNDAYEVFRAVDDLIVTGPTGTNVMDLMLVMTGDPSPG